MRLNTLDRWRDRSRTSSSLAGALVGALAGGAVLTLLAVGCGEDERGQSGFGQEPADSNVPDSVSIGGPGTEGADPDPVGGGGDEDVFTGPPPGPDGMYCQPNTTACTDSFTIGTCSADGSVFETEACPAGQGCVSGACVDAICTPGEPSGKCAGTNTREVCNEAGTYYVPEQCPGELTCFQGECSNIICTPGQRICQGLTTYRECLEDGSGYGPGVPCAEGLLCDFSNGLCIDACEANVKDNSYLGCNYFAVDLPNVEGGQAAPVAVVVSVPSTQTKPARIRIRDTSTFDELTVDDLKPTDHQFVPDPSMEVAPGALKVFLLPLGSEGGATLTGSAKKKAAYLISSDAPVTVHQFNPLNGDGVYTNDASLLLPSNLGGREYIVMGWPHRVLPGEGGDSLGGFVTIVATEPGETVVDVYARGRIAGGLGVPSIQPNQNHSFSLQLGEVLNLMTAGETGNDLTGTWIRGSQRVTVFSGHECANVPVQVSYCDHIEQQLYPIETWGNTYIADTFHPRNEHQFDLWRIVGGDDEISVSTYPPVPGFENFFLHKGSYVEFITKESFQVVADGPVLLGHYMIGSNYPGYKAVCTDGAIPSGIGDPSLTLGVSTQQFLDEYVVLTPPGYAENYLNIIRPTGTQVSIDGVDVTAAFEPVGTSGYEVARVPVQTGVHNVNATGGNIGVTAYGYDCDVSYAYPGGMRLEAK